MRKKNNQEVYLTFDALINKAHKENWKDEEVDDLEDIIKSFNKSKLEIWEDLWKAIKKKYHK